MLRMAILATLSMEIFFNVNIATINIINTNIIIYKDSLRQKICSVATSHIM